MADKTRCFIALDLPGNVISELISIQEKIKKEDLFIGKLTEKDNLHLTLKFLGSISKSTLVEIKKRLKQVKADSFEASIDELGLFSEEFVRIIWIKLNGKEVIELQNKIDNELLGMFPKEERFMSHVTIARVKNVKEKLKLIDFIKKFKLELIKGKIRTFSLMSSELKPEGPVYTVIEKYKLD